MKDSGLVRIKLVICLYKINSEGDYLDFMYTAVANSNLPSSTTIIADLSSVISGISNLDGCWVNIGKKIEGTLSYSGTQIIINSSNFTSNNGDVVIGTGNKGTTGGASYETGRVYYTSLVNN
ncbi:hypothetical protein [Lentilactobacillus buchneri]|uniref:hypothetical protein n=1 Tax=Lentilactobacillus buchneri TaxID=1581 RepID=UPI0011F01CB0|nr:hypothetical protein [Lentilactobacillus buchneri]